jgi:hypothetical protein
MTATEIDNVTDIESQVIVKTNHLSYHRNLVKEQKYSVIWKQAYKRLAIILVKQCNK